MELLDIGGPFVVKLFLVLGLWIEKDKLMVICEDYDLFS